MLYVNPTNDASPLLLALVRELQPLTARFTVCTFDSGPGAVDRQLEPHGVAVHHLAVAGTRRLPKAAAALAGLVRRIRPDVLHTNMVVPGVVGEVGRRLTGVRTPSVFTRHHDQSHHLEARRLHVRIDRWTAQRATLVVAPSEAVRTTLVKREGVSAEKVLVVRHGLDFGALTPDPRAVGEWRRRFGPGPLLVCASRVDPLKGFSTLLRALSLVSGQHPGVQLAVAGAAVRGQVEVLRAEAQALGVHDRLHLLGHVDRVHDLIAAADVYVSASEAESFGLSVLEALVLRVPLAVTTPGGVQEVVAPDYPALAPGDVHELTAAILSRLADPVAARELAARAAPRAAAAFSAGRMADGYRRAYVRASSTRSTSR